MLVSEIKTLIDGTANTGIVSEQTEPLGQRISLEPPPVEPQPPTYEAYLFDAFDPEWQCSKQGARTVMWKESLTFVSVIILSGSAMNCVSGGVVSAVPIPQSEVASDQISESNVELTVMREKDTITGEVMIRNRGSSSIALSYSYIEPEKKIGFVPYALTCTSKSGEREKVSPRFHFAPELQELTPQESVTFHVQFPQGADDCTLSVAYYSDLRAIFLVNKKIFNLTEDEGELLVNAKRTTEMKID